MTDAGPLVRLQISFARLPWRIAPGWTVLAGALAGGFDFADPMNLLRLLAALLLADVLWGSLRRYAWAANGVPVARIPAILPYATADAPLARLLAFLALPAGSTVAGWQGALAGLALTAGVSIALGWQAAVLSFVAGALLWVVWLTRRRGDMPALAAAVLDVALPGLLGLSLAGLDGAALPTLLLLVGGGFTFLQWGLLRWTTAGGATAGARRTVFWFGLVTLSLALIALRRPVIVVLAAALLAPAAWYAAGAAPRGQERAASWAWAALMVASIVARF